MDKLKFKKGFTLVEALVAVLIFSAAVVGLLRLTGEAVVTRQFSERVTIADHLSQSAMEAVRNIRDNNFLAGYDWLLNIDQCLSDGCTFSIDGATPELIPCTSDCAVHTLQNDDSWGFASSTLAGFDNASDGKAFRVWGEFSKNGDDELNVVVNVDTMDRGKLIRVASKDTSFYNWYQSAAPSGDQLGFCEAQCGIVPRAGRTIVTFNTRMSTGIGVAESGAATVNLPAGDYDVFIQAYDSYSSRASSAQQQNERLFARFYGPGGYVLGDPDAGTPLIESDYSEDVPDGVETGCIASPVERNLSIPDGVTEVTLVHKKVDSGAWQSVEAVCAAFDKVN